MKRPATFLCLATLAAATCAQSFNGYECTDDCSGHEAGYEWAQENGIYDADDCHGNSQSFNEGCQSYVDELDNVDTGGLMEWLGATLAPPFAFVLAVVMVLFLLTLLVMASAGVLLFIVGLPWMLFPNSPFGLRYHQKVVVPSAKLVERLMDRLP